jgi:hypothetical protein
MSQPRTFNRVHSPDPRDHNYLISNKLLLPNRKIAIKQKMWSDNGWWGDQGDSPMCVGYAWAHWIEDGPVEHAGIAPIVPPQAIYEGAQKADEWPGEDYDGTSVRGAAIYLRNQKRIRSYYWAFDIKTIVNTVLTLGPVVVGTDWYSDMMDINQSGYVRATGYVVGGHAYVLNGVDTLNNRFRIKNSWGKSWGSNGHAWISIPHMERLIKAQGEACIAVENTDAQYNALIHS